MTSGDSGARREADGSGFLPQLFSTGRPWITQNSSLLGVPSALTSAIRQVAHAMSPQNLGRQEATQNCLASGFSNPNPANHTECGGAGEERGNGVGRLRRESRSLQKQLFAWLRILAQHPSLPTAAKSGGCAWIPSSTSCSPPWYEKPKASVLRMLRLGSPVLPSRHRATLFSWAGGKMNRHL
eukprot:s8703_g1.t2